MRVMMISSWQPQCGVAEYATALKRELESHVSVEMVPVPTMRNRKDVITLAEQINQGDIAHIQYTSDYCGFWRDPFRIHTFHCFLKHIRIPCIVTVHDLTHRLPFKIAKGMDLKTLLYNMVAVPAINWTPYGAFLRGRFLYVADHLIVHTTASKLFLESLNFKAANISVLYPGIPKIPLANNYSMREELGWKERRIITVFGFVGPHKGYETVLSAMKHLPNYVTLLIAGGIRNESYALYLEQLKASIISFGLQDRVVLIGHLDDDRIGSLLSASDIIILPHRRTINTDASYSLSYAIAAERLVIASNKPFFLEIEQKYAAIKTFKDGDDKALAGEVIEVLNRSGREEIGAKEYREIWSWKNVAERTYQIYCHVLNGRCAIQLTKEVNRHENRDSTIKL